ncbi:MULTISPECIES: hypothetical protein [unclassified Paenibacillus]|uniref:hypothetical protein n=1 Tax=unclassified Paenibacillus TaxID=185978 RepID=UPI0024059B3D|nr:MULTISPECIES: hypothetical protein [unclassified Paenibacillus]MDF9841431.1 hypothetical protein [Paenibacillus sp. PastF-2]MDF9848021.1 hypothetical protein [Paenibacillus sp. PastM-2]MDF9854590.1 hypothetical protein [Paenibacillus sp. PastF-1]MDH6479802.1 hypothetical protein [Paenibacillus sp. PastH-2]MDH6507296.1 hypothetical protein [Paenibacillus sp. PastM-3]
MSKNRVWNRGKHNGGGLQKRQHPEAVSASSETPDGSVQEPVNPRIDAVKPMNRSNWVSRPARVAPKDKGRPEK